MLEPKGKKRIGIIGTVGIPAKYGGFETLADNLTKHLEENFDFTVYCSCKSYENRHKKINGADLKYWPLKANGIQSIPYDIISMIHAIRYTDLLLILGISGCIILPILKLFTRSKIIVNMDGLEWKRDKWGKIAKWFFRLSEKVAIKNADLVIADNAEIQRYVMNTFYRKTRLIAYGADHVRSISFLTSTLEEFPILKSPYAFKVCRIEPENNIDFILDTFAEFKDINLVIVGNWDKSTYGQKLKDKYKSYKNILLLDPIYDQYKLNQIRSNCFFYIHGHSAGGTNPSLIEAMYLGLPIIAYNSIFNIETTKNKALYFADKASLLKVLKTLDRMLLLDLANSMKVTAKKEYTWELVAGQYAELFLKG